MKQRRNATRSSGTLVMPTESSALPAQDSMTLYEDHQLFSLSSNEQHVACQRFEISGLRWRVLDAFCPLVATCSGQVICFPKKPRGKPFKTRLLPGNEVARFQAAQRHVPPPLPLLATTRSACLSGTGL